MHRRNTFSHHITHRLRRRVHDPLDGLITSTDTLEFLWFRLQRVQLVREYMDKSDLLEPTVKIWSEHR